VTKFKTADLNYLGKLSMAVFKMLHLVHCEEKKDSNSDRETYIECNNLTLINFVLVWNGPTHEAELTTILLIIQVCMLIKGFHLTGIDNVVIRLRAAQQRNYGLILSRDKRFFSLPEHSNQPRNPPSFLFSW